MTHLAESSATLTASRIEKVEAERRKRMADDSKGFFPDLSEEGPGGLPAAMPSPRPGPARQLVEAALQVCGSIDEIFWGDEIAALRAEAAAMDARPQWPQAKSAPDSLGWYLTTMRGKPKFVEVTERTAKGMGEIVWSCEVPGMSVLYGVNHSAFDGPWIGPFPAADAMDAAAAIATKGANDGQLD